MARLDYNTTDLDNLKISQLKRIAEYWYRQHLLSIVERNGKNEIWCPLKKQWLPETEMQVAHFRDRNHLDTAFDLDNTFLISKNSNVWDSKIPYEGYRSKHHYEYEMWLRTFHSEEKMEKLLCNRRDLSIFARDLYKKVINEYRK